MTDLNQIKQNLPGYFEVIAYCAEEVKFEPTTLIPAMQVSAIHSFGWPIGVVLENRDGFKPIHTQNGVRATIDSKEGILGPSYDFWELTKTGDFYLLKSLFEDRRGKALFFFDVRIKRVAETLLRIGRLYKALKMEETKSVAIKLSYGGLKDRQLSPASSDFFIALPKTCSVPKFEYELQASIYELNDYTYISNKTTEICSELFILFDGTILSEEVYKKIISQFLMKV
ncbi:hypothetical protein [Bdellovibrio bacteriovorus]|uniref:hypothetical protein n=1 Tax=Bdellovibrio bacteriovorus TaxID=959 RepID=UPI0035A5BEF9